MKTTISFIIVFIFFISCTNSESYEKISGEWECVSWINTSKGINKCNNNVYFEFGVDKTYLSELGSERDTGNYKIVNDILYVTPKGKMEFSVKIKRVDSDTIVFLMNQAGEEEILTLSRKN